MDSPQPPGLVNNPLKAYLLRNNMRRQVPMPDALILVGLVGMLSLVCGAVFFLPAFMSDVSRLYAVSAIIQVTLAFPMAAHTSVWVSQRAAMANSDLLRVTPLTLRKLVGAYYGATVYRMQLLLELAAGFLFPFAATPLLRLLYHGPLQQTLGTAMTPVFVAMEVITHVFLALGLWGLSRLALAIGVRTGLLCDNPGEAAALSVAYLAALLVLLAVITLLLLPFTSPYSGLCGGSVFLALALGGLPYALTSIILSSTEGALARRGW